MGLANRDDIWADDDAPGARAGAAARAARPGGRRAPEIDSVTTWIIVACIAVYIADRLLWRRGIGYVVDVAYETAQGPIALRLWLEPLRYWGHFSFYTAIEDFQVWRFLTFQFLHANLDHLIFNMVALYFFGPMVESYLRSRAFLAYYLVCGAGGAVMYVVLLVFNWRVGSAEVPLVGASAGIFGVLIAAALIAPQTEALVFGVFPMRLRTLAWLFIGYAVFTVVVRGTNAGGEAAHLGGAAAGWALMRWPGVLERFAWLGRRPPPF